MVGENLSKDDSVVRKGLLYKKSSDVPFTGELTGYTKRLSRYRWKFKDGKRHGRSVWYGEKENVIGEITFKDGREAGPFNAYYESGKLKTTAVLRNGKLNGSWKGYYENGQLQSTRTFKNGEQEGEEVTYMKMGK